VLCVEPDAPSFALGVHFLSWLRTQDEDGEVAPPPVPVSPVELPGGMGLPVTNSLSIADMPRVCEGIARMLESTGTWKRDRPVGGARCPEG
jgi:hypothetical protein